MAGNPQNPLQRVVLANPSAVVRAKGRAGFASSALLVTEKAPNRVALIEPP